MSYRIELRQGTAAEWAEAATVLAQGEVGIVTDAGDGEPNAKLGDGTTAWDGLGWWSPGGGGAGVASGALAPRDYTLTDAATVTPAPGMANDFTLLMTSAIGATRAIAAAAPLADCQNIALLLIQPASGGPCAVTWASGADGYDFGSSGAPALTSAANGADLAAFKSRTVNGTRKWRYLGSQGGYS